MDNRTETQILYDNACWLWRCYRSAAQKHSGMTTFYSLELNALQRRFPAIYRAAQRSTMDSTGIGGR